MKGLTKQDKDAIRDALMAYCENFPSRNRASESLQGVSAAVVSQILNTKYELSLIHISEPTRRS